MKRITLAAVLVAAALLAGCQHPHAAASPQRSISTYNGVESLHPDEILRRARLALRQAKSYHLNGEYADRGAQVTLDVTKVGTDFAGRIVTGGSTMELLAVGGEQYFRPDRGKWFKVPAGSKDFADLFRRADVDALLQFDGKVTQGGPSTVDGTSTTSVLENGNPIVTVYVARIGEPYPVRLASADGSVWRLTGFGAAATIAKPPPDQILPRPIGK